MTPPPVATHEVPCSHSTVTHSRSGTHSHSGTDSESKTKSKLPHRQKLWLTRIFKPKPGRVQDPSVSGIHRDLDSAFTYQPGESTGGV